MSNSKVALMEPPSEEVSVLNEILKHRREEVHNLKFELDSLRARITSERSQWSAWKGDEEKKIELRAIELENQWRLKIQDAEKLERTQQMHLYNQQKLEKEAERLSVEVIQKRDALGDLNKERLEIETLRRQVDERSNQVESKWSASQDAIAKGTNSINQSQKVLDECEERNLHMNEREDEVKKREAQVTLREKQSELVMKELDDKLDGKPEPIKEKETVNGSAG